MVSQISASAVNSYLERNSLADAVGMVLARDRPSPPAAYADLIEFTSTHWEAAPAACALVTSSVAALKAARQAGIHCIGYARTHDISEIVTAEGADAVIPSHADLTLGLRADPLPN